MMATSQRLTQAGVRIEEYPQSPSNLTAASQNLYDLIEGGNLRCYPSADMRLAISQAIAKETSRGWQITKQKSSHKIDVVVALALSCHAAVQGATTSSYDRTCADGSRKLTTKKVSTRTLKFISGNCWAT
jgi:phage terminase large subunit-like protein